MAYAESTIGGSSGGQFRVWVNSIRTYNGSPGENFEDWRVEGGVNRIASGSRIWNNYNNSTITVQLGINGMATSGNFSYDSTGAGGIVSRGSGTTRAYRNSAGVGFGFTSRTDVNMQNSPYLTSGWVQSSDSVQTRYRNATLTALSMDAGGIPATDEGPMWLEFSNPGGAAVKGFIESPAPSFPRIYTSGNVGSRFNFPNLAGGSLTTALQQAYPNSNTGTLRIGIHSSIAGYDTWDYRDRTFTIKNDAGQANPTYSDFDYIDENSATVAVTGSDQVLVQGKSDLKVTVAVADKATANKYATMSNYLFTIGGYSQTEPWSNTVDVVKDIGSISDVSGVQALSVRAVDSRGNGTTVSKNVTVLPYASPGFYNNLSVDYANDFDVDDGLVVELLNDEIIGSISAMTLSGVDKNEVTPTTGLQFDIAKGTGSFTGTWTNIAYTVDAGTGLVKVDPVTLATQIETRMNSMTADNTVRWYIMFRIEDKFETQYYTVEIDVGRPFFRIGADGRLYYKEIEFFETFSGKADYYFPSLLAYAHTGSTWARGTASGFTGGWANLQNTMSGANGDEFEIDLYMPAGIYVFVFYMISIPGGAKIDFRIENSSGSPTPIITGFDTYIASGTGEAIATSGSIGVLDGATYTCIGKVNGRNAANTTGYFCGITGVKVQRVGDL